MIDLEDKGMNMVSATILIARVMIVKEGTMIMEEVIDLAVFLDKDTEDALHLKEAMKITTDYLGKEIIEIGEKMKGKQAQHLILSKIIKLSIPNAGRGVVSLAGVVS